MSKGYIALGMKERVLYFLPGLTEEDAEAEKDRMKMGNDFDRVAFGKPNGGRSDEDFIGDIVRMWKAKGSRQITPTDQR